MFASRSLTVHLLRGVVGLGAFAAAIYAASTSSYAILSLPALVVALLSLRGCPMCWTVGLIQTLGARPSGTAPAGGCLDGRCAATNKYGAGKYDAGDAELLLRRRGGDT